MRRQRFRYAVALKLPELRLTRYGGAGPRTRVVCGWFGYESDVANPVIPALPRLFRVNIRNRPAGAWLEGALAERGGKLTIVTQNIDDLHERAGSARVIHMHCELLKARCTACEAGRPWLDDLPHSAVCPDCGSVGTLRPHVVWFGEMPLEMDVIDRALRKAHLFVAIGTSGAVYPAAGFVAEARACGLRTCEINLEAADNADLFDEQRLGAASETVPAWVEECVGR